MDAFKIAQHHHLGIGGIDCPCCNNIARKGHGKVDRSLNSIARAKLKNETQKLIEEEIKLANEIYQIETEEMRQIDLEYSL